MRGGVVAIAIGTGLALAAPAHAAVSFSKPLGTTGSKLHAPAETTQFPLKRYGYTEQEYLASGTATGNTAGFPQQTGHPDLPFTTRIIVRHPLKPRRGNGTVVLE